MPVMTNKEIAMYVFRWWENRKTLDGKERYYANADYLKPDNRIAVDVYTPWKTIHRSITIYNDGRFSVFDPMQYHYGWGTVSDICNDKKKIYNMLKKQQRILEHSPTI